MNRTRWSVFKPFFTKSVVIAGLSWCHLEKATHLKFVMRHGRTHGSEERRCKHTRYFVIVWRLRPGAAALHHLLPPLFHNAVQVGEDLQRTYRKTDNGHHIQGDIGAEQSVSMEAFGWINKHGQRRPLHRPEGAMWNSPSWSCFHRRKGWGCCTSCPPGAKQTLTCLETQRAGSGKKQNAKTWRNVVTQTALLLHYFGDVLLFSSSAKEKNYPSVSEQRCYAGVTQMSNFCF